MSRRARKAKASQSDKFELLNQIIELDHFCTEALHQFAERERPPDLKFVRELRIALKVVLPQLSIVEEEVYSRLAIY